MNNSQQELNKLYYSIGEVAEMFDVNSSLIRYWEKEFEILRPKKNKKGNRYFTPEDIETLGLIFHLVKDRGMTLRGAQKKLKESREETLSTYEVVKKLKSIKQTLLQLKEEL